MRRMLLLMRLCTLALGFKERIKPWSLGSCVWSEPCCQTLMSGNHCGWSFPEGGLALLEADFLNSLFQKSLTLRRLSSWLPTARTAAIGPMRWVGFVIWEEA